MIGIEDYVSVETARVLHEKGYSGMITAATLYEAQMWIWRNYEIFVTTFVMSPFAKPYEFGYFIQNAKDTLDDYATIVSRKSFGTIQEALSEGIDEALKLI